MKTLLWVLIPLISFFSCPRMASGEVHIHKHGYWSGSGVLEEHAFDPHLAEALVDFFNKESVESVVDFGCGTGDYVHLFLRNGIFAKGYDGNPDTLKLSNGVAEVADLSQLLTLPKTYDWVMSLEVGEHIPKEFEKTFIENLHRHNINGIVLSWAVKGQMGTGHVNEQDNDYIKKVLAKYGYVNDVGAECELRNRASAFWFKNSLMVFRKKQGS